MTEDPRLLFRHCGELHLKVGNAFLATKVQPSPLSYPVLGKKETPTLSRLSPVLELHGLCFKSLSTYECNNWYLLQQHFDTHLVTEFQKILVAVFFSLKSLLLSFDMRKRIFSFYF